MMSSAICELRRSKSGLSGDSAGRHFQRLDPRSWTASEGIDLEIWWKLRKMHGISMDFMGLESGKFAENPKIIQNPMVDGLLGWNVAWPSLIGKRLDLLSAAGIISTCSGEPYRLHSTELQWKDRRYGRNHKNFDSGTCFTGSFWGSFVVDQPATLQFDPLHF